MAAKQGLTAQLSQAGEDAKRAVLSRTPWFSNLNTVCTIKSAPPKSPEVLQLLATKSGWLFKRNEQHVWQVRWCCVVPHTFLYYFDAPANGGTLPNPTPQQQEEWNRAVQEGYGFKAHEKRSNFYLFQPSQPNNTDAADEQEAIKLGTQPAGIIDLECYSSVHRSSENQLILELAGDDQVNPDLRAFYFCAPNREESDDWTDALLNGRHAALVDECEAYKQVCEGFAQQLQQLHADLDQSKAQETEAQEELYRVRSSQEDVRRTCWRLVQECVEGHETYRTNLEIARRQDMGVTAAVQLVCEFARGIELELKQVRQQKADIESNMKATGQSDQALAKKLQEEIDEVRRQHQLEKKSWETQLDTVQNKYEQSQKELHDVQKELSSTRMEMTMFQNQQKNKTNVLQEHKRILKKEVVELRAKVEAMTSELSTVKHQQTKESMMAEQERQKAQLLERYVEKIESQVKVQQNMMEMMSQSGVGSVYRGDGSVYGGSHVGGMARNIVVVHGSQSEGEADDVAERLVPLNRMPRRGVMDSDMDNKSHMSELTEDRTQRHFEAYQHYLEPSPRFAHRKRIPQVDGSPQVGRGPPSYIINVGDDEHNDGAIERHSGLETIHGRASSMSLPPGPVSTPRQMRQREIPRSGSARDTMSISSDNRQKLSVAQKARLEAEHRTSTPVRARLDEKTQEKLAKRSGQNIASSSDHQERDNSSTQSGLWRRMEEAVLGPRPDDMVSSEDDDMSNSSNRTSESNRSTHVTDYTEATRDSDHRHRVPRRRDTVSNANAADSDEKKVPDSDSMANLSLQERSRLQRAKQLEFLKNQGLIKSEQDLRGGAGASPTTNDNASVSSSNVSFSRSSISFPGGVKSSKG